MSYLVLARKYRPQTLDDLVGQDHVARTLASAMNTGRIAHAFLFTGVRGVGKTTSARLLAKCLNCVGADGKRTAPSPAPCNACVACREIAAGNDLDVQEIDGASYNGIDEVRRLQEGVSFRPARDRFKIYIVDEVHMLSTPAWNAFLKTLEEPPPHAKFIFATTEVHKVPVTILSRCQRYDFKLIPAQVIARRLQKVLEHESIEASDDAIQVLAREAAGSMRDAMSLLDQVIAFSGTKVAADDVSRVLGIADRSVLHDLGAALLAGDAAGCLRIVASLAEQGFDFAHLSKDILTHLRNLVVAKVCSDAAASTATIAELLDLADTEVAEIVGRAARADVDDLTRCFQGFSRAFDDIVRSGNPRLALEMVLVRLARRPRLLPLDDLVTRLAELERRLDSGSPSAPSPRGGGGPGRTSPAAVDAAAPLPGRAEPSPLRTRGSLALAPSPRPEPSPVSEPDRAPAPEVSRPALVGLPAPLATPDDDAWHQIIASLRTTKPAVASVFEHAVPVEVGAGRIVVSFEDRAFLEGRAAEPEAIEAVTQAARRHFGAATAVCIDSKTKAASGARTIASVDAERHAEELSKARAAIEGHPLVREAVRVFGAEILDVRLPSVDV